MIAQDTSNLNSLRRNVFVNSHPRPNPKAGWTAWWKKVPQVLKDIILTAQNQIAMAKMAASTPATKRSEIKKTLPSRNPEVQLAIKAAGILGKKQRHKWDTSMFMAALAVNRHNRSCDLVFEFSDGLFCRFLYNGL